MDQVHRQGGRRRRMTSQDTTQAGGWVEEAMRMLRKFGDANYAEGTADACENLHVSLKRNAECKELRNAIRAHLTEQSAAAEGMREALEAVLMWGTNTNYMKAGEAVEKA